MNKTAGSMNREDYWAWLDDLRVGDDVILYWTGGSFGHFKGMAKLVRVNPKSVAGALLEPVATETHGGGYPEGHIIIVPRSPIDRRFSEFFNAPMLISVNRIERSSGEKESNMNKIAVAKELVAVAKELTAINKQKYKGYTIEKSGINFYVTDPSGHRAFGEVPASIETAKKWIDLAIREKGGMRAGSNTNKESDIADRIAKNVVALKPWSPAMMKTWTDYVAEPLRIAQRDMMDTVKNLKALAEMRGEPSEQMLRTIDRMQELLDEAVEYSGKVKTRLYEAREHVVSHLV